MRSAHRLVALSLTLLALAASACSSSTRSGDPVETTGRALAAQMLHAPVGYVPDKTPGADGTMSGAVFTRDAGGGQASQAGFRGGFKQVYNSQSSNETIDITLLRFASPTKAQAYLRNTVGSTLSLYAPTRHPYPSVPGAVELVGTKAYDGIWTHAVIATKGDDYMFLVYLLDADAAPPLEYGYWIRDQYRTLS